MKRNNPKLPAACVERARRGVLYHARRLLNCFPPEGCRSCVCDEWIVIPHHEFGSVGTRPDRVVALTRAIENLRVVEWHDAKRRAKWTTTDARCLKLGRGKRKKAR